MFRMYVWQSKRKAKEQNELQIKYGYIVECKLQNHNFSTHIPTTPPTKKKQYQ